MATLLVSTASGLLLGAALLGLPWRVALAFVGLGLLAYWARIRGLTTPGAIAFAAAAGALSSPWLPAALESLGATTPESYVGWLIAIAWSGLPHLLFVYAVIALTRRSIPVVTLAAAPAALGAWEALFVRLPGSVPWTLVGYTAIETPGLSGLAVVGGVPLVSATTLLAAIAASVVIDRCADQGGRATSLGVLAAIATVLVGGNEVDEPSMPLTRVAVANETRFVAVQPQIPRGERMRASLQALNADRLTRFTTGYLARQNGSQPVVVWPENVLVDFPEHERQSRRLAAQSAQALGTPLVLGITTRPETESESETIDSNSVLFVDATGVIRHRQDKHRAVPIIESSGGIVGRAASALIGDAGQWSKVGESSEVSAGTAPHGAIVALCFEVLFPQIVDARRSETARIVLNLADDSWARSDRASRQLTDIARFRAIEQGLPLIRVAHGGLTAAFDASGRELERLPLDQYGALELTVAARERRTLVTRLTPLGLPVVIGLGVWWMCRRWLEQGSEESGVPGDGESQ